MDATTDFTVMFWGTRGSIACAGPHTVWYGGNTPCLEVTCGDRRLIFDGGTGLPNLGRQLAKQGQVAADLFLTHTHLDHVVGIPFFAPLHRSGDEIRIWAGHLQPMGGTLRAALRDMMNPPLFPVPPEIFQAKVTFKDFNAGETLDIGDGITLRTAPLKHPNGCTGYRVDFGGRSLCYITDTEHVPGERDQTIVDLVAGSDLMIYDCTYTDDEFPRYVGFGHSTWQEGVRICEEAGVKQLAIFHHAPEHDDDFLDHVAVAAERARKGTVVAREGQMLELT